MDRQDRPRPFYSEFAWAFDLLIDRPVRKECDTIATWLVERGVVPGGTVLDAGCGTGRHAIELGRRGYAVCGVDMSADLLAEARRSLGSQSQQVCFAVGDLLTLPASGYDAILCRGVLNDLIDDDARLRVCLVRPRPPRRRRPDLGRAGMERHGQSESS